MRQRRGSTWLVAENHRFRPSVRAIEALLERGDLGVLKRIRINVMGRTALAPGDWRAQAESMGGGPFIDGGIHRVNVMLTYGGGGARHVSFVLEAHRAAESGESRRLPRPADLP